MTAESVSRSACCTWPLTKLVLVEAPGFATVRHDGDTGLCTTEFGASGATIDCLPIDGGSYAIFPASTGASVDALGTKGCLRLDSDGTAVYYPNWEPGMRPECESVAPHYILQHADDVLLETVDPDGRYYGITRMGVIQLGFSEDSGTLAADGRMDDPCVAMENEECCRPAADSSLHDSAGGAGDEVQASEAAEISAASTAGSAENAAEASENLELLPGKRFAITCLIYIGVVEVWSPGSP